MHRNINPRWWLYTDLGMKIGEDERHNLGIQHSIILDDVQCQQWMVCYGVHELQGKIFTKQ
jgi:hypothetical protein